MSCVGVVAHLSLLNTHRWFLGISPKTRFRHDFLYVREVSYATHKKLDVSTFTSL